MTDEIEQELRALRAEREAGEITERYYERKVDGLRVRRQSGKRDATFPVDDGRGNLPTILDEGATIGPPDHRFRLLGGEPIGTGGMGEIWRAEDLREDGEIVALKVLPSARSFKPVELERLKREAKKARALNHQNIVNVFDWHEDKNRQQVFISMEYLKGQDLDQLLQKEGPERLPLARVLALLGPVASAIDWTYQEKRLVHRDLKSGNIFVTESGGIKVLDFGLSAEARDSSVGSQTEGADRSGTIPYMPPEAFARHRPHPSRDIYALAVVGYELLTGYVPWGVEAAPHRHTNTPWSDPPESLSKAQWRVLQGGLAFAVADRPSSCGVLLQGIKVAESKAEERQRHKLAEAKARQRVEKERRKWEQRQAAEREVKAQALREARKAEEKAKMERENRARQAAIERQKQEQLAKERAAKTQAARKQAEAKNAGSLKSKGSSLLRGLAGVLLVGLLIGGIWFPMREPEPRSVAVERLQEVSSPLAGTIWTEPTMRMKFVWVPAGRYQMGSDFGDDKEKPLHKVAFFPRSHALRGNALLARRALWQQT